MWCLVYFNPLFARAGDNESPLPIHFGIPVMVFYTSVAHSPPLSFVQDEDTKSVYPVFIQK